MRILIDPVYTGKPSTCSTSYLAWKIINQLSDAWPDAFFYLLYPQQYQDVPEEMEFLSQRPDRVKLFPHPYIVYDRVEELFKTDEAMIKMLAPGESPVWDFDVMITSRIHQIPFLRNNAGRQAKYDNGTFKLFLGLEEMPIFQFRKTVAWAPFGFMDLMSMTAYLNSGGVLINNFWTKKLILREARQWFSPSRVLELGNLIHEVFPIDLQRLDLSEPKTINDKTLNVVFTGRMTGTRNFKGVADIFRKHFSFPLGKGDLKVNYIASTNSLSSGAGNMGETDFIDIQKNDRKKFHTLLREKAHVVVNLSTVEDFSLSTYEPLTFGVPVIVPNEPWADFLGPDYPFRVNSPTEAYGMVKVFALEYDTMMQRFVEWESSYWAEFVASDANTSTVEAAAGLMDAHMEKLVKHLDSPDRGDIYRDLVQKMNVTKHKKIDAMDFALQNDVFVCSADSWRGIPMGKRPNMYLLKVYMNKEGWRDTLEPGIYERD